MKSKIFSLDSKDAIKALIIIALTSFLTAIYEGLVGGGFTFTWDYFKPIVTNTAIATLGYIIKNWLSNSNDEFLKKEEQSDADTSDVRHSYKLAVMLNDGKIATGSAARNHLNRPEWDDVPFEQNIPLPNVLPQMMIRVPDPDGPQGSTKLVRNPAYDQAVETRELLKEEYYRSLTMAYNKYQIIMMAYNPVKGWFLVPDQHDERAEEQWWGFISQTFLMPTTSQKYARMFR